MHLIVRGGSTKQAYGCVNYCCSIDHGRLRAAFLCLSLLPCLFSALLYDTLASQVALVALRESLRVRERILHPFNKELLRTIRLVL